MPRKTSPESEDPAANASGSGGEEEEEYEIEEVLDAKRGYFPEGRIGYLVKWKGYDADQNSWVDELDAVNAKELVDEYWRKNPKKKGRKSLDKKRATQEDSEDDNSASVTKKKRGRKSTTKDESDEDMDVDVPAKKKKSNRQAKAATPSDEEEPEKDIKTMDSFMHIKNWESLVKVVDTVEKDANGDLYIYFTLSTGEAVRAKSDICKQRFPYKLLDFYEENLRWRTAQED